MLSTDEYHGICVLTAGGDFLAPESEIARAAVTQAIDARHITNFIIELDKCGYIDSQGLETLCWIRSRCDELFGMFKLVAPEENCRKILEITRLDQRFDIEPDLTTALKAMR